MVDVIVSYARANRAMAERVAVGLERAGYSVSVDRGPNGAPRPIEEVAVDLREAAAYIPLISDKFLVSPDTRQTTRTALLYDQRVVPVRIQADADVEALAMDIPVLIGTRYEERQNDLADVLAQSVDLSHSLLDDDVGGPMIDDTLDSVSLNEPGGASFEGRRRVRDRAIAPLLDELDRLKILPGAGDAARARLESSEPVYDSYGFQKSTEAMLARWRQIENEGSIKDFERFEEDYEDDPFFATLAAETADQLRRKRTVRMADLGMRAVMGSLFAGLMVWGATAYCNSVSCGSGGGNVAVRPVTQPVSTADAAALAAARRDALRFKNEAARLSTENSRLKTSLKDAQTLLARQGQERTQPQPPNNRASGTTVDSNDMRRLSRELSNANQTVAQLQNELRRRDQAINSLRSEVEQRTQALRSRDQQIAGLQSQLSRAGSAVNRQAVAVPARRDATGDGSGMERIMSFYRDRFNEDAGRSGRYSEPVFTAQEIKMLQACLLKRTGRLSLVDGRWGRETTGALLGVTVQESDWVIDCVLES